MKKMFAAAISIAASIAVMSTTVLAAPDVNTAAQRENAGQAPPVLTGESRANLGFPLSDQDNSKNWVLDEGLSDEFDGAALNTEKWQPIPYTWSGAWRWEDKNGVFGLY